MTSSRLRNLVLVLLAAALAGGCSRLFARHRTAVSQEIVIDTRRDPVESLSGCFIPEVMPAVAKVPVAFDAEIPARARFTGASCEVLEKSGDALAVLEPVITGHHVYLHFALAKMGDAARVRVRIQAKYEYR